MKSVHRLKSFPTLLLLLLLSVFSSCSSSEEVALWNESGELTARLKTVQGDIVIRLMTDHAPLHSENFARLCDSGMYDGTYFHRVAPEVLIQGGDFNTKDEDLSNDGQGGYSFKGPGTTLEAEITEQKHLRGFVSMARGSEMNSAGSQFFILLRDDPLLDGKYSVFGEVIGGLEVVELISEQPGAEFPEIGGVNPEKKQVIEDCFIVSPETELGEQKEPEREIAINRSL